MPDFTVHPYVIGEFGTHWHIYYRDQFVNRRFDDKQIAELICAQLNCPPRLQSKRYEEVNATVFEHITPDDWEVIDRFIPSSCPWDYYALKHQKEYRNVLSLQGIPCVLMKRTAEIKRPIGSGPNGAVRFGDNMTPGEYRIAVPIDYVDAAVQAIKRHRDALDAWVKGPATFETLPIACQLKY